MPTTRRKSGNPHSTSSQSTLLFNNKSSRVTKPSLSDPNSSSKKSLSKLSDSTSVEVIPVPISTPEPETAETTDLTIRESPRNTTTPKTKSKRKPVSNGAEEEARAAAEKITDAQLKKYWQAEEDCRIAPRVHQNALPLPEKILRHFDLSSQYGPCIGLPRLKRWHRANNLGLNPPVEVLAVLLREEKKTEKERVTGKMAYMDELANGRNVFVEP